ncbi:SRPBCC family protein [Streptomyces sp. JNUCC 64]
MPPTAYEIVRETAASREEVFAAWTEPGRFARWFGPRMLTTPVERVALDVRPGGRWRAALVGQEGFEALLSGWYREVDAPRRLTFTTGDVDRPGTEPAFLSTLLLERLPGPGAPRTLTRFHQRGVNTDAEHVARVRAGWLEYFERLDEYLAVQTGSAPDGPVPGSGPHPHTTATSSNVSVRPRA